MPAAVLITDPFRSICEAFAPTIGAPGYPSLIAVPHPVASRSDEELYRLACSAAAAAARLLTGPELH